MKESCPAAPAAEAKQAPTAAYVSILASAVLWGTIGLWTRHLTADGLSAGTLVALRNFGGFLLLGLVMLVKDRSVFRVKRAHLKYFFGTGVCSTGLMTTAYFRCQDLCSLSVASILLYTAPSFVVLLSAILWKEPITRKKLLALVLTLIGCACVCGVFSGDLTATVPGILLGLGSGFFYSLYSIFGRYALRYYPPMTVIMWTFVFAGPVCLLQLQPAELAAATPQMWLLALGMVVFGTVGPYICYTWGLARVESGKASIMASLEPVAATLTGILVFGEPMGILTLLGVACVLAGVYILR